MSLAGRREIFLSMPLGLLNDWRPRTGLLQNVECTVSQREVATGVWSDLAAARRLSRGMVAR